MPFFQTINDFRANEAALKPRKHGIIETVSGKFVAIHLRPWPKLLSIRELLPVGDNYHAKGTQDRCLLYYNQPMRFPNFLSLKYIVTSHGTSYKTFLASLRVLDALAKLKQSDAILCDASNLRISDRLLKRLGWEAHKPQRWHRNFIKRFYGQFQGIEFPSK